jgi:hypothetical protein
MDKPAMSAALSLKMSRMPRLAMFYGIIIWMYRPDHPPPHFHAQYGDDVAQIELATLRISTGHFHRVRYGSSGRGHDSTPMSSPITGGAPKNWSLWRQSSLCPSMKEQCFESPTSSR